MADSSSSSRREFLKGRSAMDALSDGLSGGQAAGGLPAIPDLKRQNSYLEHYSKQAMACEFEFFFNMQQYPGAAEMAGECFELVDHLEAQWSIYRDDSEFSRLNRSAHDRPIQVDEELFELLRLGRELFQKTDGAFDMTAFPLSVAWGFHDRQGAVPDDSKIQAALQLVGMNQVELSDDELTVQFSKKGMMLDPGAIGKGRALDKVVTKLMENGIDDFVLHGGQSSVVARGSQVVTETSSGKPDLSGWNVGITHPRTPDRRIAQITLHDEALGTSGTARQGFFANGKRYGHVIDPRTGWPTDHFLSTTVIAPTASRADALATAFFVMSLEAIEAFCKANQDAKAICIVNRGPNKMEIESFNLDANELIVL